jgi:peptidoglycan/LPS O-acetylase OafA/YrhL
MGEAEKGERPRREVFDVLKGIGILEVVIHHSLSHGARKFADPNSLEWWALRVTNRVLHFAIPLFLLVSAVLLTQSLRREPDWPRFVKRRVQRTLWPYLLWSVGYLLFRLFFLRVGSDTETITRAYPLLGELTGPRIFVDIPTLVSDLLWGKAYYHLYFLLVLLQMAALLPLFIAVVGRTRWSFGQAGWFAAGMQLGVFLLQSHVLRAPYPASLALWYVPSLTIGVWIGAHWEAWAEVWRRNRAWIAVLACLGAAIYLPTAIALQAGREVDSLLFNAGFSAYAFGVSLLLFGFAPSFALHRAIRWVAPLGRMSLAIFLIHPAILHLLSGPRITGVLNRLPLSVAWSTGLVLLLSYVAGRAIKSMRADHFLFGQSLAPSKG